MSTEETQTPEERPPGPPGLPTRWQVAVHEAAHAVYARAQGMVVKFVTLEGIVARERGEDGERCDQLGCCYSTGGERLDEVRRCVRSLVGPAAEHRVGGPERLLPYEGFVRYAEGRPPESDGAKVLGELRSTKEPEALYESAREQAQMFVKRHWPEITTLAEAFMDAVSLDEEGVELVFDPAWAEFQEMLEEIAREDDLATWVRLAMEEFGVEDPDRIGTGPDGEVILLDP